MLSLFLLSLPSFILTSCKKDPYNIGLDLLPPTDTLHIRQTDTATIIAYSVLQDSVRTDLSSETILGSIMDPVLGSTTASFYTQFELSADQPSFGNSPVLDSLVLLLQYKSIYGDSNALQNVKVFEVSEDMHFDSAYYSNQNIGIYPNMLANFNFRPFIHDSVLIAGQPVQPHLRINLNHLTNYLGNKLLEAPPSALLTSSSFKPFMKGLYIQSSPVYSEGALIGFEPIATYSKLVVYFHNELNDSLHFDFLITSTCTWFNHFNHNGYRDASPDFKRQVLNHDTTLGKQVLYLQGLGGVKTRLRIPFLKLFANLGKIAINDAELVIKNYETDTTLAPPATLNLLKVDSTGAIGYPIDYNEGSIYLGGVYDKTERTYKFRITRHVQQVIQGKIPNYDLYIMMNDPLNDVLVPNRFIMTGTKPSLPVSSSDRVQLKVIYTRLQ